MAMRAHYVKIHVQTYGSSTEDVLHAAKVARKHGLQVTLTDGLDGVDPALIVNLEVSAEDSQQVLDAVRETQKFLIDVLDVK